MTIFIFHKQRANLRRFDKDVGRRQIKGGNRVVNAGFIGHSRITTHCILVFYALFCYDVFRLIFFNICRLHGGRIGSK
ncbi:MAG: hypothetical protein DRP52_04435 [Planctomycetota bacterium]|nr:MAG: hypothetical protein DRP52_04435 [Planctomycetota bacterium]